MKSIKYILLFFLLNIQIIYSQNFFPLKVGNEYQVKCHYWGYDHGIGYFSGTFYYDISVLSDSLIENEVFHMISNSYFSTGQPGPFAGNFFFRYDSLKQKVFIQIPNDTTRLAIDFSIPQDSFYISFINGSPNEFKSDGLNTQIVFGDTVATYSMYYEFSQNYFQSYRYHIANELGLYKFETHYSYNFYIDWSEHDVISAIIDSVIYNPIDVNIDSLYPIHNRKVNEFPFELNISYTGDHYSSFVDSLFLFVEWVRNDTVKQDRVYNVPISEPKVNLFFLGLEEYDIIKLRAVITDNSIYNNINHYPDTGWIYINILPITSSVNIQENIITYTLLQNYPNPFNPSTTIKFTIANFGFASLKIYDVLGNEIATLVNEEKPSGEYEIKFDGSELTSGIYFYKIQAGDFIETKKMLLIK